MISASEAMIQTLVFQHDKEHKGQLEKQEVWDKADSYLEELIEDKIQSMIESATSRGETEITLFLIEDVLRKTYHHYSIWRVVDATNMSRYGSHWNNNYGGYFDLPQSKGFIGQHTKLVDKIHQAGYNVKNREYTFRIVDSRTGKCGHEVDGRAITISWKDAEPLNQNITFIIKM